MKKKLIIIASILLIAAALVFWFFFALRSYLVMSVYSLQQSGSSVMHKNGFLVDIPTAAGWYPFVMTYNAEGFAAWSGIDADMSIMYNFGAFDACSRVSSIYDQKSDKYSSFYGAYIVQKRGGPFGFSATGALNADEVTAAVKYDYSQLVIAAFGCAEPAFTTDDFTIESGIDYAGSGGWTRIYAKITANGAAHNYTQDKTSYLQYGAPTGKVSEDFAKVGLFGRIYAKYFKEYDCTVMIYVIAPAEQAAGYCDRDILQKTQIQKSQ